nr:hypothetical protein [Phycisphaerae bacterium]
MSLDTVDNFTPNTSWEYLASCLKPVPAGADSVILEYVLLAQDLEKVGDSPEEPHVTLELRSSQQEVVDSRPGPKFANSGDIAKKSHRISRDLNDLNSPKLKAVVRVQQFNAKSTTFASLGHIYDFSKTLEKEQATESTLATEFAPGSPLLLQTYSNPFNSETTIKYTIKRSGRVRLNIYNI